MKVFKQSNRVKPKISLILLDWSVRESFHLLHYLSLQNIPRDQFEVVIIEYYSRRSEAIEKFEEQVDTWIALEMSEDLYYHKHLMYNAGIVASTGEICIICDSDAMAKPTFLESVIKAFEQDPNLILHLDQFRNNRKDLYPFCYPSFDDVTGPGCINIKNGKTTGLAVTEDLIHNRNYGACFCAKREDLIKIGGADEHIDFIGHICGPYDFTFRLMNIGKKEVWHETEFLYHTWHPGQAGENNYLGPHDGRHVSTTSLEALTSKRVSPHVINPAIAKLQKNSFLELKDLEQDIILPDYKTIAKMPFLMSAKVREWAESTYINFCYRGWMISKEKNVYQAIPTSYCLENKNSFKDLEFPIIIDPDFKKLKIKIDRHSRIRMFLTTRILTLYSFYRIFRRILAKIKTLNVGKKIINKNQFIQKKQSVYSIIRLIRKQLIHINQKLYSKFRDLKKENDCFIDDMYSFLLNINYYFRENKNCKSALLVANRSEYRILKTLIFLKLMPNKSLLIVNNIDFNHLSAEQFFMSRHTFTQNLDIFQNKKINAIVFK